MLQLAFRSFFFIAVILGYSTGIWRLINDYFRHEFQSYLEQESKANKYILQDPPAKAREVADAPRLPLDETIVNVGRTFADHGGAAAAAGGGGGGAKAKPEGDRRKVTNSISELPNPIVDSGGAGGVGGGVRVGSTVPEDDGTTLRPFFHGKGPAMGLPTSRGEPAHSSSSSPPAPRENAAKVAEHTDIRQVSGGAPNREAQGPDEAEGDKWISYWEQRGDRGYRDADVSAGPRFCSIAPQPSGENPSAGILQRSQAASCGGQEAGHL